MIVEKFEIDKYRLKINKIGKLFVKSRYFVTVYPPPTHTFFFFCSFHSQEGKKFKVEP